MRARNSGRHCFRKRVRHRVFISVVIGGVPITLIRNNDDVGVFFIIHTSLTQSHDGNYHRLPRVITISREKQTMLSTRTRVRWINGNLNYTTHDVFD